MAKVLRQIDDEALEKPFDKGQFLRLLRYLKPYKGRIAIALVLMVVATVCSLGQTFLLSRAVGILQAGTPVVPWQFVLGMIAMAAIIALDSDTIETICARTPGIVVAANYNSDGQVVISGEEQAVKEACAALKAAGAKRALPLPVSGAFHSPLMEPARKELAEAIARTEIHRPLCPVYQNVTAQGETEPGRIKDNLLLQLTSPVRWTQSVKAMLADGASEFTEIGPGSVLQGLVGRIAAGREDLTIQGIQ